MREIKNFGLIGDGHGCGLISREGEVSWLTFRRFDAPPACWSLLDDIKGGSLQIKLPHDFSWSQRYLENTNILVTEARNSKSVLFIYDFMPVGRRRGSGTYEYTRLDSPHALFRILNVEGSPLDVEILFNKTQMDPENPLSKIYLSGGKNEISEISHDEKIQLKPGEDYGIILSDVPNPFIDIREIKKSFFITRSFWKEWLEFSLYRGPHKDIIERSALTLKLLIHSHSGAILAAPTTSLPECIGGVRNWDYRYCWIRDATFTLYALSYLGYSGEADAFADFISKICENSSGPLKVLYDSNGGSQLPERELPGVHGFRGSRPVRVGNEAAAQTQLDTHGEFLDWAHLHLSLGGKLSDSVYRKIRFTSDWVSRHWKDKDRGIWEIRSAEEDHTYSKIMCWVALDRAEKILRDPSLYFQEKCEIEIFVKSRCVVEGRLVRSPQNRGLDASLLLTMAVGFPISEEVYEKTVNAIMEKLFHFPFVKRYEGEDGINEGEGDFLVCSFWLINALLYLDRADEAERIFSALLEKLSPLGLLSEEYDRETESFLGNFPQALSHLALIETASYFEVYKKKGRAALWGSHADRALRMNSTLHGPQAVYNFVVRTGKFHKLLPSRSSVFDWTGFTPSKRSLS